MVGSLAAKQISREAASFLMLDVGDVLKARIERAQRGGPIPTDKTAFFERAWAEVDRTVTRDDASDLTFYFAEASAEYADGVVSDIDFEVYMDKLLEILRHPENDLANLKAPAPETPTWQWLERLILGAMEKSIPKTD